MANRDALAHVIVLRGLRLDPDIPQRRTCDGMGDHQAQCDGRMTGQRRTHGGMTMKIDISLHPRGQFGTRCLRCGLDLFALRSEEHTSELQSLMRISYTAFCVKKKK